MRHTFLSGKQYYTINIVLFVVASGHQKHMRVSTPRLLWLQGQKTTPHQVRRARKARAQARAQASTGTRSRRAPESFSASAATHKTWFIDGIIRKDCYIIEWGNKHSSKTLMQWVGLSVADLMTESFQCGWKSGCPVGLCSRNQNLCWRYM